jgi:hypothetical protein
VSPAASRRRTAKVRPAGRRGPDNRDAAPTGPRPFVGEREPVSGSPTGARRGTVALEDGTPYRDEVSSFVDALEALLRERSLGAIGPSDIAHQANRTVALFFQCFKDERGPMSLLVSRMIADRLETSAASFSAERWRTASLLEIIRSAVDHLVALVRTDDPVSRAAAEASLDDRELMDLRRSALTFDVELFRRLLVSRADELPDPDARELIGLVARQVLVALDREMLLGGGDDLHVEDLADQLVTVATRLLGLRAAPVRLAEAEQPDEPTERRAVVVLADPRMARLLEAAVADGRLGLDVVLATTVEQALERITAEDAVAVFCPWDAPDQMTPELLDSVRTSPWLGSLLTVVLTTGAADELSTAYAWGARVAVTTPGDSEGFVLLLEQLDRMLGSA